ncbi:MAG TPA: hypothetical protein VF103_14025, partial [Polyangiaceae bacterium]
MKLRYLPALAGLLVGAGMVAACNGTSTIGGGDAGEGGEGDTSGTGGKMGGTGGKTQGTGGTMGTAGGGNAAGTGGGGSSPCDGKTCGASCTYCNLPGMGSDPGMGCLDLGGYCAADGSCGLAFPDCGTSMCNTSMDCGAAPDI